METRIDLTAESYTQDRLAYWEQAAQRKRTFRNWGATYHRRLGQVYRHLVAPGLRVLELGCGQGDLLASLKPSLGVGVDFSSGMIQRARQRHPELHFIQADVHALPAGEPFDQPFDVIILSDLLNDVWDVQRVFEQAQRLCSPHTRLILNTYSRLWELPLLAAQKLGLAQPVLYSNWLTMEDLANLAALADFEVLRHWQEVLCPLPIPLLEPLCNRWLVKVWPFHPLGLTNLLILRPRPQVHAGVEQAQRVSVIVPARNEADNIAEIFSRTPQMGLGTELIFVEGHSKDNTCAVIEEHIAQHPHQPARLLKQSGIGKGNAVREGFSAASGDILMILDADLTVPPEDLPRFYEALVSGKGELINGVRLVYPMEKRAMPSRNATMEKLMRRDASLSWVTRESISVNISIHSL